MHTRPGAAGQESGLGGQSGSSCLRGSPTPHSCRRLGPSGSVPVRVRHVSVLSSAAPCASGPFPGPLFLLHPHPGEGLLREAGACASAWGWLGPLSSRVLPRPAPVPVPRGAVPVWGGVCREERGSRVCVPADVPESLQPRVWRRRGHLRQHLRAGGHRLRPGEGDPCGSSRTL